MNSCQRQIKRMFGAMRRSTQGGGGGSKQMGAWQSTRGQLHASRSDPRCSGRDTYNPRTSMRIICGVSNPARASFSRYYPVRAVHKHWWTGGIPTVGAQHSDHRRSGLDYETDWTGVHIQQLELPPPRRVPYSIVFPVVFAVS